MTRNRRAIDEFAAFSRAPFAGQGICGLDIMLGIPHPSDVPFEEMVALVRFYHATNGPGWTNKTNWLTDPVVNNWFGVTVFGGHVTQINLNSNGLNGPGLQYLSALTSLTYLNLYNTSISGNISSLSALTSLTYLNLYNTSVSGNISSVSALTSLTYLGLGVTSVSGNISSVSALASLTYLNLYNTSVSGNISSLSALTSLTTLNLAITSVSGDISSVSALTSLTILYLYNSSISGNISSLSALTSLTYLNLAITSVSGDISSVSALTSLTHLYLYNSSVADYTATILPAWSGADIRIQNLTLTQTEVDNFLVNLDTAAGINGLLNISGNSIPSATGQAAITSLQGKGWTVTYDS